VQVSKGFKSAETALNSDFVVIQSNFRSRIYSAIPICLLLWIDIAFQDGLNLKVHDFGFRGSTCVEGAGIGGCAHLVRIKTSTKLAHCYW